MALEKYGIDIETNLKVNTKKAKLNIEKLAEEISNFEFGISTDVNALKEELSLLEEAQRILAMSGADYFNINGRSMSDTGISNMIEGTKQAIADVENEASEKVDKIKEKLKSIGEKIEKIANKIKDAFKGGLLKIGELFIKTGSGLLSNFNKIPDAMSKATKMAKRFTLSLIGAQTAFVAIRKGISQYLGSNKELQDKLSASFYAIGSLFAPLLESLVNGFVKLVGYADVLVKKLGLAGINMKNFNKEASKTTASFDEINNVSNNQKEDPFATLDTSKIQSLADILNPESASEMINSFFANAMKTIESIPWNQIGETISNFLMNFDWNGAISNLFMTLGEIIGAFAATIWPTIKEVFFSAWESIKESFIFGMEQSGGEIIFGLLIGILDVMHKIYQWIVDHIFTPFVEGFKKIFGIHSPSTVFEGFGQDIVNGLFNGLSGLWTKIKSIFENLITKVKEIFSNIKSLISSFFSSIGTTISTKFKSIINNYIITPINKVISWINSKLNFSYDGLSVLGKQVIPAFSVQLANLNNIPLLNTGTNYVPNDQLAMIHQGEAVIPKEFNKDEYFNNEETNGLLRDLIDVVSSKEFRAYISEKEVGRASVKYINSQSRILGGSLV